MRAPRQPRPHLQLRDIAFIVGTLAFVTFMTAMRPPDDVNDRLDRIEARLQQLDDALGLAGRDKSDEPFARRLERLERSLDEVQRDRREDAARSKSSDTGATATLRRDLERATHRFDDIAADIRHVRDVSTDLRRLQDTLNDVRRDVSRLDSRVSRLERD